MTEPVLVLRALGLGDALTGVPALRGLRRLHPDQPLLLAAPATIGDWFTELGLVDGCVPTSGLDDLPPGAGLGAHDAVNLHGRGPQSHALLLAGRPRSLLAFAAPRGSDVEPAVERLASGPLPDWRDGEHEVLRWCRLVGRAGGACGPEGLRLDAPPYRWRAPLAARAPDPQGLASSDARGYVVLHPGAASGSRRWPVDRWVLVAEALSRHADVRLTGGADERDLCRAVATAAGLPDDSVAGALGLDALTRLVSGADLLVCGDTGVAHVATATATRSVLLFGPTSPRLWGPVVDTDRHVCLWHGDGTGDPHAAQPDPALLRITAAEVVDAAERLLGRVRR